MIGYIQAFLYILSIALSSLWVDQLGEIYNAWCLLLGVSIVATLVFNLMSLKSFMKNHKLIFKDFRLWFLLSLTMAACWYLTYEATIISSPRVLLSILFTSAAGFASIATKNYFKFMLCIIAILFIYLVTPESNYISLIESLLAGLSFFLYFRYSTRYADKHNLKTLDILSVRFYLLILISLVFTLYYEFHTVYSESISLKNLLIALAIILLLGIVNMVIPNFFSQSSSLRLGAEKFSLFTSLTPVITFLLQGIFYTDWNLLIFFACLFVSITLNYNLIAKKLKRSPTK
ncbi:hypothetical protein L3V82_04050 [Thiotrichales bacterium 19S3-7]|nr:hypothetical protein [Thiotrichales bacterium 19S3-7]MCF6801847.1 hypothetical protein [Thiotrichales bacterium 19S3-11]